MYKSKIKKCFLTLSHLKIHIILFLDKLIDVVGSTGNLSSTDNSLFVQPGRQVIQQSANGAITCHTDQEPLYEN